MSGGGDLLVHVDAVDDGGGCCGHDDAPDSVSGVGHFAAVSAVDDFAFVVLAVFVGDLASADFVAADSVCFVDAAVEAPSAASVVRIVVAGALLDSAAFVDLTVLMLSETVFDVAAAAASPSLLYLWLLSPCFVGW